MSATGVFKESLFSSINFITAKDVAKGLVRDAKSKIEFFWEVVAGLE